MRFIVYAHKNNGVSFHRLILPFLMMNSVDVYITNNFDEKDYEKGCDMVVYNRVLPEIHLTKIEALKKKMGFKIAVDIDDFWELDERHVLFSEYQEKNFAEQQISNLKRADVVLTTHERLAKEVAIFNPNVHICPNAIPYSGQFAIEKERYHLTRLFWQGSVTHRPDIELLGKPIDALGSLSKQIKMVMAGFQDNDEEWHSMAQTYTANFKHQYKIILGANVAEYYKAYAEADICLIPLLNTKFNAMKSNLKVLEAANLGLPVIASAVNPYLGMPLLFCRGSHDWIRHITRLVKSSKRRRDAGAELQEYCKEHYNFHKINNMRREVLEYEVKKVSV